MMINKRLISLVPESIRYIVLNVVIQWLSLLTNIMLMSQLAAILCSGFEKRKFVIVIICALLRAVAIFMSNKMSYLSSRQIKKQVREKIYDKLLKLGNGYDEKVSTSEVVQLSVEGVEQLETYFGSYLPQFFYAMLAPLTLFVYVSFISFPVALVLLICVPLIPVTIAKIQRWAKKLLSKYWDQYTSLGSSFLENLQGLTTLKIYQADEQKNREMNEESERFRVVTMKVLTMQLNSVTIMDLITYLGVGLGVILSVTGLHRGNISVTECVLIILLSADFFLPMRTLGSYFHVAMNGMAASDKIFALLDLETSREKTETIENGSRIDIRHLSYSYDGEKKVLDDVSLSTDGRMIAVVGESGCGKSTLARILTAINHNYEGSVTVDGRQLSEINEASLLRHVLYVDGNGYLFKGTVRENLLIGRFDASDQELWDVIDKVNMREYLESEKGLDSEIAEGAANISGGQKQRLVIARSLLHEADCYIFDEVTSNVDVESEEIIMKHIRELARDHQVILISHRLANVTDSFIYVLDKGVLVEQGTHRQLMENQGIYRRLYSSQQELETYGREVY